MANEIKDRPNFKVYFKATNIEYKMIIVLCYVVADH